MKTTDLCDEHPSNLQVAEPVFRDFGGVPAFSGRVVTLRLFEDNSLVRTILDEHGEGKVLVIDGGGSLRCALVGDRLAKLAVVNGWSGILVHGCVRDTAVLADIHVGIKALAANPRRSEKEGEGERDVPVSFAGVDFQPGHFLVADEDGVVVSDVDPFHPEG